MIKVVFAYGATPDMKMAFGKGDGLPWPHCKEDMQNFKKLTEGCVVLMGANTWKSLPKSLPGRVNVVMSKYMPDNKAGEVPDQIFHGDLYNALHDLQSSYPDKDICVIGGVSLILEAIDYADEVHASQIVTNGFVEADVTIPDGTLSRLYDKCLTRTSTPIKTQSDEFVVVIHTVFKMKK